MKPCLAPDCEASSLRNSDHCLACTKRVGTVTSELTAALIRENLPSLLESLKEFVRKGKEQDAARAKFLAQFNAERAQERHMMKWASVADINNTEAVNIK